MSVKPIQFNKADAEQMLAAYTPYVSVVMNNITIPKSRIATFINSANCKYELTIRSLSFLSAIISCTNQQLT